MNFWQLGVPSTVVVDDFLPLRETKNGYKAFFAKAAKDGSMWPLFLEKGFAKLHGNYAHLEMGSPSQAVSAMTGAPAIVYKHDDDYETPTELWDDLVKHRKAGDIMTSASGPGKDTDTDDWGVVLGHAFTILDLITLSNGVRLLKLRNPWGSEVYHGKWSDQDDKNWTPELMKEAKLVKDVNDGIFHIAVEDYHKRF